MNSEARKRAQERKAAEPCTTCMGPSRETVGMVCQSCGRDYAPHPAMAAAVETFRAAWETADALGWPGRRVEAGLRALLAAGWTPPAAGTVEDDLRSRLACVAEATSWDRPYDERIAAIRGMCDLTTDGMTSAPLAPWLPIFLAWLDSPDPAPLDFHGNPIPARLADLLQQAFGLNEEPLC